MYLNKDKEDQAVSDDRMRTKKADNGGKTKDKKDQRQNFAHKGKHNNINTDVSKEDMRREKSNTKEEFQEQRNYKGWGRRKINRV